MVNNMSEKSESKQTFWNATRIAFVFLLLIGIVIGAALEHYFVEPLISGAIAENLKRCESENYELHSALTKCHAQVASAK